MIEVLESVLIYALAAVAMAGWMVLLFLVDGNQVMRAYRLALTGVLRGKAERPRCLVGWFLPSSRSWWRAKVVHVLTFLFLSFVVCRLLALVPGVPGLLSVVLGCALVVGFGYLTEALQGAAGRGSCLQDVLVNAGAGVLGGVAAFLYLQCYAVGA